MKNRLYAKIAEEEKEKKEKVKQIDKQIATSKTKLEKEHAMLLEKEDEMKKSSGYLQQRIIECQESYKEYTKKSTDAKIEKNTNKKMIEEHQQYIESNENMIQDNAKIYEEVYKAKEYAGEKIK